MAHGCNAQGVMASGIAKTIRAKYPKVYEDYKIHEKDLKLDLGDVVTTSVSPHLIIASAITQRNYGRNKDVVYVSYDAVETAFHHIFKLAEPLNPPVHPLW